MSLDKQLSALKRLDRLIQRKGTGTAAQLAEKMEISRASVYRLLEKLKTRGAPIDYCRYRRSYYYAQPFELKF